MDGWMDKQIMSKWTIKKIAEIQQIKNKLQTVEWLYLYWRFNHSWRLPNIWLHTHLIKTHLINVAS